MTFLKSNYHLTLLRDFLASTNAWEEPLPTLLPPLDTPEALHSASTSPMSSVLLQTPPNPHRPFVNVIMVDLSPVQGPYFVGLYSSSQKAKDCAWPICICVVGCLVAWFLSGALFFLSFSVSLFPHLNRYLCSALSLFCLFATPLPPQHVWQHDWLVDAQEHSLCT
jgi:hypothetical protein